MGTRKPHPTRTVASARAYLLGERGSLAAPIIEEAEGIASILRRPSSPLTPKERKRARKLATELRGLAARSLPESTRALDALISHWSGPAKRGRRRDVPAVFAYVMMRWAAKHGPAKGLSQLTATELMAAAVASGVEPPSDPRESLDGDGLAEAKERMLDSWRKYDREQLEHVEKEIASEFQRREAVRQEWLSRSPLEQLVDAMTARAPWEENPPRHPIARQLLRRTG